MTPKFKHDCDSCKFLGHFNYDGRHCDFYECSEVGGRTIIARYSDEGPDYSSGPFLGCVELTGLDWAVLARGLALSENEKTRLIQLLMRREKDRCGASSRVTMILGKVEEAEEHALGPINWVFEQS